MTPARHRHARPHTSRFAGLTLVSVLLAPAASFGQQPDFSWHGRLAQGRTIEIVGVLGDIDATPAAGDEIEVTATKRARRSDPDEVTFDVIEHAGGVTICAVYPDSRAGRPNECRPGGGRMNTRNNDVNVDFTIRVPAGVHFTARTVNGEVDARGLTGDIEASTVNGAIRIATAGFARAKSVNGSIDATLGRADWNGDLEFETVNGGITLELPASLSAEVRARTVNGGINSDFPLQVQGRFNTREVRAIVGNGGRRLELGTVNGSIRLRRVS